MPPATKWRGVDRRLAQLPRVPPLPGREAPREEKRCRLLRNIINNEVRFPISEAVSRIRQCSGGALSGLFTSQSTPVN
jgi:hypothetical protein